MLLDLPRDAWRSVAVHLAPPDVLAFLSAHRAIRDELAPSPAFWGQLLRRDRDGGDGGEADRSCGDLRREFMLQAYKSHVPCVRWLPLDCEDVVSAREGHLSCVVEVGPEEKRVIVTGGFVDDQRLYMLRVPTKRGQHLRWGWRMISPEAGNCTNFAYGATLTALPTIETDDAYIARAVRFGGFQGGGYVGETNEAWLLAIKCPKQNAAGQKEAASWRRIRTGGEAAPRAYHAATLVKGRYLLVVGGTSAASGSMVEASVLDTEDWTWTFPETTSGATPRGRHGHSIVWDGRRDRAVVFGGGDGTSILRSGIDDGEVWELRGGPLGREPGPWAWSRLHCGAVSDISASEDSQSDDEGGGSTENGVMDEDGDVGMSDRKASLPALSPAESLCLGRCHNGLKIAPGTVLLMFGGGQVNTNGVLGYDLRTDVFVRPKVLGPLPIPRFTGIASLLENEGYVFVHGGFNSEEMDTVQDVHLLDLVPLLHRDFRGHALDGDRRSNPVVTDADAQVVVPTGRGRGGWNDPVLGQYLMQLFLASRGGEVMGIDELDTPTNP